MGADPGYGFTRDALRRESPTRPDPGDELTRSNMARERAALDSPGHEPDPGNRLMRSNLGQERAEMSVARNDPGIASEMGADPGYGLTRTALRREGAASRPGLAAARTAPAPPPDPGFSLFSSAQAAVPTSAQTGSPEPTPNTGLGASALWPQIG